MTAIDFPNSPAMRDLFGTSYQWDGEKWIIVNSRTVGSPAAMEFLSRTTGLTPTQQNNYVTLIEGLEADGVWSKFDALYMFAAPDATNAVINLVSSTYNATRMGSMTFDANFGFTPSGASTYIDSNLNISTSPKFTRNDAHISMWCVLELGAPSLPAWGGFISGCSTNCQLKYSGTSLAHYEINGSSGAPGVSVATTIGHYIANRSGASAAQSYKNGVQIATNTVASAAPFNANMIFGAYNNGGSITAIGSSCQFAMASIGSSLNSTQATAFYNRVLTFLYAVGTHTPEVLQFLVRATGLDVSHTAACTALINGLVADGIWTKLDVLYVLATQNGTLALLNLVSSNYNGTANGSPTFTTNRGYTGVDSSNTVYIDTGFNPTTASSPKYTQNDAHLSVWMVNNDASQAQPVIGNGAGSNISAIIPKLSGANAYFPINANWFSVANTNGQGHFVAVRPDASNGVGYRNGSSILSGASAVGVRANYNMNVLGFRLDGTPYGGAGQVAAASIGGKLTATEVANFYARLRTYMTAVGVP